MGKHRTWRKNAKKERRRRIRKAKAKERCDREIELQKRLEASPTFQEQAEEAEFLEHQQQLEEQRQNDLQIQKWKDYDKDLLQKWLQLQIRLEKARSEKERQEQIIRTEWEQEQKQIAEKKRELEAEKEAKRQLEKETEQSILNFIENGGEIPTSLAVSYETNPNKEICPFFKKTGACRFKDLCSRNHVKPGISSVLLMTNFYTNFSMDQCNHNEYDSDIGLEYDDADTYADFVEFYHDVLPELEKYGDVVMFRVCKNFEQHLRGNVYVQYSMVNDALKAYKNFHGRWYGGKQITVEFVTIPSWKSAICGVAFRNKCPKGRSCNFMHVFLNPGERHIGTAIKKVYESNSRLSHTRWSESPELEVRVNDRHDSSSRSYSSRKSKRSREWSKRRSRSRDRNSKSSGKSQSSERSSRRRSVSPHKRKKKRS